MKKLKIFLTYISSNRVWIITLACLDVFFTTDAEESNGIIFQSKDNGATWEYSGNTQKMN